MTPMRVLFAAGREPSYARNEVLIRALRRLGAAVDVVAYDRPASLLARSVRVGAAAARRLLTQRYDLVLVGFYGHLLLHPLRTLARAPVLFDAFVSTYDTLCFDRRTFAPGSLPGRLAFWLDQSATRRAAHVLLDTDLHADYFSQTFGLPRAHFSALPVGCNETLYYPRPAPAPGPATRVLFYCTFLPLHGADVVLEAAERLRAEPGLQFTLLGAGPQLAGLRARAARLGLANVTFAPAVPPARLADAIAAADLVLGGHFGPSAKAGRVVPGKLYQILAMARPLIAGDTPANRNLLTDGREARLCPPGDAAALAGQILDLHRQPAERARLGQAGYGRYQAAASEAVITAQLRDLLAAHGWLPA